MPSWWERHAVPRLVDLALSERATNRWRRNACAGVAGEVLELGFGSGRNLRHYGPGVTHVQAVEPSDLAWARAREAVEAFGRPVTRVGLDGAALPVADHSVDAVVSTWTMCTIPDLGSALREVGRVLRPGGSLHFAEHSLAPTPRIKRVQRTLQPLWGPVAGGCHLDRDIPAAIAEAGFEFTSLDARYQSDVALARPFGWFVTGVASRPNS